MTHTSRPMGAADLLMALAVVVLWGLNFIAMKYGLRSFSPFQLGALRYLSACLPMVLLVRPPRIHWKWVVSYGLFVGLGQFGFLFLALQVGMAAGLASVREIVGKVWPYILAGIGIGAAIHGWVPQDFMASFMGKDAWWSVPLAVLIGVPMYTNAAGVIPIVQALLAKGAALGTVLAFMMSVIALSLPELIILRKVLKVRLIATFVGVVATGILIVGFVFNAVL